MSRPIKVDERIHNEIRAYARNNHWTMSFVIEVAWKQFTDLNPSARTHATDQPKPEPVNIVTIHESEKS